MAHDETRPDYQDLLRSLFPPAAAARAARDDDGTDDDDDAQERDDDQPRHGWMRSAQFSSRVGLARAAMVGGALSAWAAAHAVGLVVVLAVGPPPDVPRGPIVRWCVYALAMSTYHWLEFLLSASYHPETTSVDSFLVNQSTAYQVAVVAGWAEFWLEFGVLGWRERDGVPPWAFVALAMMLVGQSLRTSAMATAGRAFTHRVVTYAKASDHTLVTWGVYRYLRHPSYVGWFWWSLGTQMWLGNPVCFVAYFFAARSFFRNRVPIEEEALERFFPGEYAAYKRRTWLGIPL